jgi:hypothetical protein
MSGYRAGLWPWDNRGKANSWQKKCEALQYCDSNEFIELTVGTSRVLMSKPATNIKHNVNIHM